MRLTKTFLILILSFISINADAKRDKVVVFSAEIDKFNTNLDDGLYNKFLRKLERVSKIKFDIKYFPPIRAKKKYLQSKDSCYFPLSLDETNAKKEDSLLSKSIGDIFLYGIRLKSSQKKEIGSFAYRSLYKEGVSFGGKKKGYPVVYGEQLIEMLDRKRVDFIYASIPDIYLYFENGKADFDKKYIVDSNIPVKRVSDYFACKGLEENQSVITKINKIL